MKRNFTLQSRHNHNLSKALFIGYCNSSFISVAYKQLGILSYLFLLSFLAKQKYRSQLNFLLPFKLKITTRGQLVKFQYMHAELVSSNSLFLTKKQFLNPFFSAFFKARSCTAKMDWSRQLIGDDPEKFNVNTE
jgi:hypothetical protein